jgi:hypothetical protein
MMTSTEVLSAEHYSLCIPTALLPRYGPVTEDASSPVTQPGFSNSIGSTTIDVALHGRMLHPVNGIDCSHSQLSISHSDCEWKATGCIVPEKVSCYDPASRMRMLT